MLEMKPWIHNIVSSLSLSLSVAMAQSSIFGIITYVATTTSATTGTYPLFFLVFSLRFLRGRFYITLRMMLVFGLSVSWVVSFVLVVLLLLAWQVASGKRLPPFL